MRYAPCEHKFLKSKIKTYFSYRLNLLYNVELHMDIIKIVVTMHQATFSS